MEATASEYQIPLPILIKHIGSTGTSATLALPVASVQPAPLEAELTRGVAELAVAGAQELLDHSADHPFLEAEDGAGLLNRGFVTRSAGQVE